MQRRQIHVRGTVQGVGFRPFVFGLAARLELGGFVRNRTGGVDIEVEGETAPVEQFLAELRAQAPPLARIERIDCLAQEPIGETDFRIEHSAASMDGAVVISPDVATCDKCLREMMDPRDRRYGYPFLNCTNCGPRLTIVRGAPYDRARTTMADFAMCSQCRAEYENPMDRRFHAQPAACPICGPRLSAVEPDAGVVATDDPLGWFVIALQSGRIGAMKGLGGYHLVCDAANAATVAELRQRKNREEKPFAVMVASIEQAQTLCEAGTAERQLLLSASRPIVLLRKGPSAVIAASVAPGNPYLGVMLPYTPLHHLLFLRMRGAALVMTSGNRADEPIAYEDEEALQRLKGIADVFLVHNRPIHVRCDDSVTRVIDGIEAPIRRSRGYTPQPISLPTPCPQPILATGGQLKATFALGLGTHAIISHHLGDLDHLEAYLAFERDVRLYEQLFAVRPHCIAHDLHPDYVSTRYALKRASAEGIEHIAIQHHHAHLASCMAENGLDQPVIGVTLDGTGYGTDGTIWGGEFLVGDYHGFERAAHLRCVGMPGGDQAIREPWRMAISHLRDADCEAPSLRERIDPMALRTIEMMLERRLNTPLTSSAGRLFDAVAALAHVRDRVSYEGQAAIELEWLATGCSARGAYPFDCHRDSADEAAKAFAIDTRPTIRAIADDAERGVTCAEIARRFHSTMVDMIASTCQKIREDWGINEVVLSGGVFLNALLTTEASQRLGALGFHVYRHRLVPPNDGGLSLGQLAIALHHHNER